MASPRSDKVTLGNCDFRNECVGGFLFRFHLCRSHPQDLKSELLTFDTPPPAIVLFPVRLYVRRCAAGAPGWEEWLIRTADRAGKPGGQRGVRLQVRCSLFVLIRSSLSRCSTAGAGRAATLLLTVLDTVAVIPGARHRCAVQTAVATVAVHRFAPAGQPLELHCAVELAGAGELATQHYRETAVIHWLRDRSVSDLLMSNIC